SNGLIYTYIAVPALISVSPTAGPVAGGTTVTLVGAGLSGATAVTFGATPATSFTVNSGIQITAVAPAGTGTVQITVTTAGGTSNGVAYTYVAVPTIGTPSPAAGPTAGGTSVSIPGTALTTTASVTFGGAPAAFTVVSDTLVTVVTPAGAAGAVDVVVTTSGGSATGTGAFTYVAPPEI
ncbi:IPT/TIG domain-containing protein, partial [Nocardia jinanensis]